MGPHFVLIHPLRNKKNNLRISFSSNTSVRPNLWKTSVNVGKQHHLALFPDPSNKNRCHPTKSPLNGKNH